MTFEEACKLRIPEQRYFDSMSVNYLYSEDLDVCNYVVNNLPEVNENPIFPGRLIDTGELKEKCLEEMEVLGDDLVSFNTKRMLLTVPISMEYDWFMQYSTVMSVSVKPSIDLKVSRFLTPKKLYESSIYGLTHELVHSLKETSYSEYADALTLGEVIPLFYELISFNASDRVKKDFIRSRLLSLLNNKSEFLMASDLVTKEEENGLSDTNILENSIYQFVQTRIGCYLNSFYYAVILYNMYKENPGKILKLVSMVLNKKITTLDMLEHLGIYACINGEVFEKEVSNIKKLIR